MANLLDRPLILFIQIWHVSFKEESKLVVLESALKIELPQVLFVESYRNPRGCCQQQRTAIASILLSSRASCSLLRFWLFLILPVVFFVLLDFSSIGVSAGEIMTVTASSMTSGNVTIENLTSG